MTPPRRRGFSRAQDEALLSRESLVVDAGIGVLGLLSPASLLGDGGGTDAESVLPAAI